MWTEDGAATAVPRNDTVLTDFAIRHALLATDAVIEEADKMQLSGRDSLKVLELLENAARALPQRLESRPRGTKKRLGKNMTGKRSTVAKRR
jgi:uncharacterized protein (DUF1778 family)